MAKITLFLDKRAKEPSIKLLVSYDRKQTLIALGISLQREEQWDGEKVVEHPNAQRINAMLQARCSVANIAMLEGMDAGKSHKDVVSVIRERLSLERPSEDRPKNMFIDIYRQVLSEKSGRTWQLYEDTLMRIRNYVGEDRLLNMKIEEVTVPWIEGFDRSMAVTRGINSRAIDLRNLRAVCMYAWKRDLTTHYAFKQYTIKKEDGDISEMTTKQFSDLFSYDLSNRPDLQEYKDIALLSVYLMGINIVDLHALTKDNVRNGYLRYKRAKTHRNYCVKLEPEAKAIIDKYAGVEHLLSFADRYKNHTDYTCHMNDALKKIGPSHLEVVKGSYHNRHLIVYEPIVPDMTYYRLRHTFACMMANDLDIPKDTIALCLGHGRKTVTDVYVRYDQRKIDDANRKMIDYIQTLIKK